MRMLGAASTVFTLTLIFALAAPRTVTSTGSATTTTTQLSGQDIYRNDTFGNEQLWTEVLRMQQALVNLSPKTALTVGLKVDADALPQAIIDAIKAGQVNLDDPAVTIQLLKLNAVVGVIGRVVGANDHLSTVGITCALCHSTVDDSVAPGIGTATSACRRWAVRAASPTTVAQSI
jgi:hypothetical protein